MSTSAPSSPERANEGTSALSGADSSSETMGTPLSDASRSGTASGTEEDDIPKFGGKGRRKKKILRRRKGRLISSGDRDRGSSRHRKSSSKKSRRSGYFEDEAEDSDDDMDSDSEDISDGEIASKEMRGFIVHGDEESDLVSETEDSDASDSDSAAIGNKRLRRARDPTFDDPDDDDLVLLADAAKSGQLGVGLDFVERLASRRGTSGEQLPEIAEEMEAPDLGDFGDDADDEDDYDSDGLGDFIIHDGEENIPEALRRRRRREERRRKAREEREFGALAAGATLESVTAFNEIFQPRSINPGDFGSLFGENIFVEVHPTDEGELESDDEDYVPDGEADATEAAAKEPKEPREPKEKPTSTVSRLEAAVSAVAKTMPQRTRPKFEPSYLSQYYASESDQKIRARDQPERLQMTLRRRVDALETIANIVAQDEKVRQIIASSQEGEEKETKALETFVKQLHDRSTANPHEGVQWIAQKLLIPHESAVLDPTSELPPSMASFYLSAADLRKYQGMQNPLPPSQEVVESFAQTVLKFVHEEHLEVPYIWSYKREELTSLFPPGTTSVTLAHLWSVFDLDLAWHRMQQTKYSLAHRLDQISFPDTPWLLRARDQLGALILNASSEVELRDISTSLITVSIQSKVAAYTNDEDVSKSTSAPLGTGDANLAGLEMLHLVYSSKVGSKFIPNVFLSGMELVENHSRVQIVHKAPELSEGETLQSLAASCLGGSFSREDDVIRSATVTAVQLLLRDASFRKLLRHYYFSKVTLITTATETGKVELDLSHPLFGVQNIENKPLSAFHSVVDPLLNPPPRFAEALAEGKTSCVDSEVPSIQWENANIPGSDSTGVQSGWGSRIATITMDTYIPPVPSGSYSQSPHAQYIRYEPRHGGPLQYLAIAQAVREGLITTHWNISPDAAGSLLLSLLSFYLSPKGIEEITSYYHGAAGQERDIGFILACDLTDEADRLRCEVLATAVSRFFESECSSFIHQHMESYAQEAALADYASTFRKKALMAPPTIPPVPLRRRAKNTEETKDEASPQADDPSSQISPSAMAPYPWQRVRPRTMVVVPARTRERMNDVCLILNPEGDCVEYIGLEGNAANREEQMCNFMFKHNPEIVAIPAAPGMLRIREVKKSIYRAAYMCSLLVDTARTNYRTRLALRRKHGRNIEHSTIESIRAAYKATFHENDEIEASSANWCRGIWRSIRPRVPPLREDMSVTPPSITIDFDSDAGSLRVVYVEDDVAMTYRQSKRNEDYKSEPIVAYAISIGRSLQDPFTEFAHIWSAIGDTTVPGISTAIESGVASVSSDVFSLRYSPLQELLPPHRILAVAERVMTEIASIVGFDINSSITKTHLNGILQFLPGMGPRKANTLLTRILGLPRGILSRRSQLLSDRLMGPVAYRNVAPFIRVQHPQSLFRHLYGPPVNIDPKEGEEYINEVASGKIVDLYNLEELTDVSIEDFHPLDATRIPPELYDYAWGMVHTADTSMSPDHALEWESVAETGFDSYTGRLYTVMRRTQAITYLWMRNAGVRITDWWHGYLHASTIDPTTNMPVTTEEPIDYLHEQDLPQFAMLLESDKPGKFLRNLELIKMELRTPFVDLRRPNEPIAPLALMYTLTGETPVTFRRGAIIPATVVRSTISRVTIELECGLRSYLTYKQLSIPPSKGHKMYDQTPVETLFPPGRTIHIQITDIHPAGMYISAFVRNQSVLELIRSSTTRNLVPVPLVDSYTNIEKCLDELASTLEALESAATTALAEHGDTQTISKMKGPVVRAIGHPQFRNFNRADAEAYLEGRPVFESLFRPSSLGVDHLTLTYKIAQPNVYMHMDILEKRKNPEHPTALGDALIVDKVYVYDDLDEILARHIDPISKHHSSIRTSRYYRDMLPNAVEQLLLEELQKRPGTIPYFISPHPKHIGYYRINYIARKSPRYEFVKVVPEGFKWRGKISKDWRRLIDDFKQRLRQPFDMNRLREREKQQELEVLRRFADTPDVSGVTGPVLPDSSAPRLDAVPRSRFGGRYDASPSRPPQAIPSYAYDAPPVSAGPDSYSRPPLGQYPPRDDMYDRSGYRAPPSAYRPPGTGYQEPTQSHVPPPSQYGDVPAYSGYSGSHGHGHNVPPSTGQGYPPGQYGQYDAAAPRSTRFGDRTAVPSSYENVPPSGQDPAYGKHPHPAPGSQEHGTNTWSDVMADANALAEDAHPPHGINDPMNMGMTRRPVHSAAPRYSDI